MDFAAFRRSLAVGAPPAGLSGPVEALWHAARGDWRQAHRLAQDAPGADAAWVHAYLHRVEGDLPNARYWYGAAGRPVPDRPLDEEWDEIAAALLDEAGA